MSGEQDRPAAERSASVTRAPQPEIVPPVVEVRPGVWKLARLAELEAERDAARRYVSDANRAIDRLQAEVERLRVIEHAADRVWRAWNGGTGMEPSLEHLQEVLGAEVPPHLECPGG